MKLNDLFENRHRFHFQVGGLGKLFVVAGIAVGIATVGAGIQLEMKRQLWAAFLLNLFFFFTLALGGMAFSAMQDVIGAVWARPIKRLHEGFGSFIPFAIACFILFLGAVYFDVGDAGSVYRWIENPEILDHFHGKRDWLVPELMVVRDIFALLIIGGISWWQMRMNLVRDQIMLSGDQKAAAVEGERAKQKLRFWSAPILVVYSLCYTLLGFDLLMSLSPLWFSTLWGGWLFSIMMQTLMAIILLTMFVLKSGPIGAVFQRQHFHDFGKLLHGFSIFFAYLTYAHVLTYWYGNVPEETEYFLHRMHGPWIYFLWGIPLVAFILPLYLLLIKAAKWTPFVMIPLCFIILVAQWCTSILVVSPEVVGDQWSYPFVLEGGMLLLFLSLFFGVYFRFGKKYPMICLGDPLLKSALEAEHH